MSASLLLLTPAMLLHDAHSLEEEGGLLVVRLAALRNTAAYYESRARRYEERLQQTRAEIAKYEAKHKAELDKVAPATAAADTIAAASAAAAAAAAAPPLPEDALAADVDPDEIVPPASQAVEEGDEPLVLAKRRAALERLETMLDAEEEEEAANNVLSSHMGSRATDESRVDA